MSDLNVVNWENTVTTLIGIHHRLSHDEREMIHPKVLELHRDLMSMLPCPGSGSVDQPDEVDIPDEGTVPNQQPIDISKDWDEPPLASWVLDNPGWDATAGLKDLKAAIERLLSTAYRLSSVEKQRLKKLMHWDGSRIFEAVHIAGEIHLLLLFKGCQHPDFDRGTMDMVQSWDEPDGEVDDLLAEIKRRRNMVDVSKLTSP